MKGLWSALVLITALCTVQGALRRGTESRTRQREDSQRSLTPLPTLKQTEPRNNRKLDIVIAHYHPHTVHSMLSNWTHFLELDKVVELRPTVFVYCLNDEIDLGVFKPVVGTDGFAKHMPNVGREGAVYLSHITNNWDNLAEHTLFSQAVADPVMNNRFENLFGPKTGVMSLALYAHQMCTVKQPWLPTGQLTQLYAMFVRRMCPPEGYSAMFNGQFIVSRKRIKAHPKDLYEHVNELLTAPIYHWIHSVHKDPHFKFVSNPFFGHALERAWSLAFDCHDLWRFEECGSCDSNSWRDCHTEACQCLD